VAGCRAPAPAPAPPAPALRGSSRGGRHKLQGRERSAERRRSAYAQLIEREFPAMVNVTEGYGSSILGYPRIGPHRELKRALESYWRGSLTREELLEVGRDIQDSQFRELAATGLTQVP